MSEPTLDRDFFVRDSRIVARELLNKVLVYRDCAVRIVEVEAYLGGADPASHAFRGETPRNRTMFGPAGHLYVYFSYGMHWCANAVCGEEGDGFAVLLRAGRPLVGLDHMRSRRAAARRDRDLCSGPAKLCQALDIDGDLDGTDLCGSGEVSLTDDGTPPPARLRRTGRIGLSVAGEKQWRWYVPGDSNVSRP